MNRDFILTHFSGLEISARRSAVVASILLWVALVLFGNLVLDLPLVTSVIGATIALTLHLFSVLFHNLGHAWIARRTGYPMTGIRLYLLLGVCLYPIDEKPLPAAIHLRRALGGPLFSTILSVLAGLTVLALRSTGGVLYYVSMFFFLENLLLFALGSLLPLGFTDGSTLLRLIGKKQDFNM